MRDGDQCVLAVYFVKGDAGARHIVDDQVDEHVQDVLRGLVVTDFAEDFALLGLKIFGGLQGLNIAANQVIAAFLQ